MRQLIKGETPLPPNPAFKEPVLNHFFVSCVGAVTSSIMTLIVSKSPSETTYWSADDYCQIINDPATQTIILFI